MRRPLVSFALLLFIIVGAVSYTKQPDSYDEELVLRRTLDNHVAAVFRFRIETDTLGGDYDYFPSQVGDAMTLNGMHELHFSLARGHWRSALWGYPPADNRPAGAEIWAWFGAEADDTVDQRWANTINTMSGLFCSSLRQTVPALTSSPKLVYRPHGLLTANRSASVLRHAMLASENICTENLSPWKKLLVCKQHGLVTIMNPLEIAESHYHSIAVDVTRVCAGDLNSNGECARTRWRLDLSLIAVVDHEWKRDDWKFEFTIRKLFFKPLASTCKSSGSLSNIIVENPAQMFSEFTVSHGADEERRLQAKGAPGVDLLVQHLYRMSTVANYTSIDKSFSLQASYAKWEPDFRHSLSAVPVTLHTYLGGTGYHTGTVVSIINSQLDHDVSATYFHVLPWYMRVYLHTAQFTCERNGVLSRYPLDKQFYRASLDRERPSSFEFRLRIPADSSCRLSMEFDKAFLRNNEYPPDANHGFHIPPPELQLLMPRDRILPLMVAQNTPLADTSGDVGSDQVVVRVFGEPLLLVLATPDFSMPYNVICMVCTVMALAFGPVFNVTTRTISIEVVPKDTTQVQREWRPFVRNWLRKQREKLLALFGRPPSPVTEQEIKDKPDPGFNMDLFTELLAGSLKKSGHLKAD